jgi:hypothetical protein
MSKANRQKQCWCGSGQFYKDCHKTRGEEPPLPLYEGKEQLRKSYSKKYCLHAEAALGKCDGPIIQAHTIQKNGGLSKIARDGHVYLIRPARVWTEDHFLEAQLLGVNSASTFTGFCRYHDNLTFAPIEKASFQANEQHTFLLAYRGICHELFQKSAQSNSFTFSKRNYDRGRDLEGQRAMQEYLNLLETGVDIGLQELVAHKREYDKALMANDFRGCKYYIIWLENIPDFLVSGSFLPEFDFDGKLLQDLGNLNMSAEQLSFSVIATDSGGAIVFSWLGEGVVCSQFVKSLHNKPDKAIPYAIARLAFEHFENICISPPWLESLTEENQQYLIARQLSGLPDPDLGDRQFNCLMDDNIRLVNWTVSHFTTNLTDI